MILEILKAIVLGIVEGATEFLPISSTGHLILVNQFISFSQKFTLMFDVVIQLGAILAVVVYFWKRLWPFSTDAEKNKEIWSIWFKAVVGVLPAVVFGALFASKIEEKFFNPWAVAVALLLGGIVILYIEAKKPSNKITSIKSLSYKTAFYIGLVQCLSLFPGVSRSGATIMGAIIFGASRLVAAEFSFFLAIPTMVAATSYSLFKYRALLDERQSIVLLAGFAASFLVALAAIRLFMSYIQKNNFKLFGWYRIALGTIIVLFFVII